MELPLEPPPPLLKWPKGEIKSYTYITHGRSETRYNACCIYLPIQTMQSPSPQCLGNIQLRVSILSQAGGLSYIAYIIPSMHSNLRSCKLQCARTRIPIIWPTYAADEGNCKVMHKRGGASPPN